MAETGLEIEWLGLRRYEETLERQRTLVKERIEGRIGDRLLLLEHHPIITIGSGGDRGQVRASAYELRHADVPVLPTERGGGATLHGPGQLVAYPIIDLRAERDLHGYLRRLETAIIATLAEFDISGETRAGLTGVWVGPAKIASIGIRVRGWVASHGLSINIANDLKLFDLIDQCGLAGVRATSIREVAGNAPPIEDVACFFAERFGAVFGYKGSVMRTENLLSTPLRDCGLHLTSRGEI